MTDVVWRRIMGVPVPFLHPPRAQVVLFYGDPGKSGGYIVAAQNASGGWSVVRKVESPVEAVHIACLPDIDDMLEYDHWPEAPAVGERIETVADVHRRLRR